LLALIASCGHFAIVSDRRLIVSILHLVDYRKNAQRAPACAFTVAGRAMIHVHRQG
jgi:hypothetical protein